MLWPWSRDRRRMRPGAQRPPPCIPSAFVLFEVCTRAAWKAVEAPTPRTQRQARSLGKQCAQVCASWGRGCGGPPLDSLFLGAGLRTVELLRACLWWGAGRRGGGVGV